MGVTVGPGMLDRDLDLTIAVVVFLVWANIVGALISFVVAPWVARVSLIPAQKLVPFIIVILLIASYPELQALGRPRTVLLPRAPRWLMFFVSGAVICARDGR